MTDDRRNPDDLDALREASDVLGLDSLLSAEERAARDRVRAFVDAELRPHIADWFDRGHFPVELAPALGRLGVLGMTLDGYGCPGRSAVEYGLAALELEAGDSGIRTFVSVQGSLPQRWMDPIASEPCTDTNVRMPESPASSSSAARPYSTALRPGQR